MTAPTDRVRVKTGAPVASDFAAAVGTPIVIDETASTGKVYFQDAGGTIREVGDKLTTVDTSSYGSFGNDAVVFGKSSAPLAANADQDIVTTVSGSGIFLVRNNTDGGVILATADMGTGVVTIVSDPSAYGRLVLIQALGQASFGLP